MSLHDRRPNRSESDSDFELSELVSDTRERDRSDQWRPRKKELYNSSRSGTLFPAAFILIVLGVLVLVHRDHSYTGKVVSTKIPTTSPTLDNSSVISLINAYSARLSAPIKKKNSLPIIRKIRILGERNSGTNFLAAILKAAFAPRYSLNSGTFDFGYEFGPLGGKHMFRHNLLSQEELAFFGSPNNDDVLWLLSVRSPCNWGTGMYHNPWHMCAPKDWLDVHKPGILPATPEWRSKCKAAKVTGSMRNELKHFNITRLEFWDMPWIDFQEAQKGKNFSYYDIFELRNSKELLMLQLLTAFPDRVRLVHLKLYERSPERLVGDLVSEYDLKLNEKAKIPKGRPHKIDCLTIEERNLAVSRIDWRLESAFGFLPSDCHVCHGHSN